MGDKISQYTKDATSDPIKGLDLMDMSNEDGGGGFDDSKKIKVDELMAYINLNVSNLYILDGTLSGKRTVDMSGNDLIFDNGLIISKSDNISDNGFLIHDDLDSSRASFKYDVGLDSAVFELENSAGTFFTSINGETRSERLAASYSGVMGNYTMIVKAINTGTTSFLRLEAATLSGKFEFGTSLDQPNFRMYDKTGAQIVNIDTGSSSTWFLRPVGINMTGGTARLSVKAIGVGTNRTSRVRNSANNADLWHTLDNGVMGVQEFTVASLPSVASIDSCFGVIIVSDETGGRTLATSDGTNWRRVSNGAIVS